MRGQTNLVLSAQLVARTALAVALCSVAVATSAAAQTAGKTAAPDQATPPAQPSSDQTVPNQVPAAAPSAAASPAEPNAPAEQAKAPQSASATQGFQDIVVVARRVSESAQRVPVAITTFSGRQLQSLNIVDVTQLQRLVPGVTLCCQAFNNRTNLFVRGIQNGAPTYFADAPVTSEGYSNFFDIANFEVLKGPQGTLFGQASNAGAFVISPNRPSATFGGYVAGTVGDYGRRTIEGAVNVPIVSDRVLLRIAAIDSRRNGYVQDQKSGANYGQENYWIVRPSLTLKITDNLENYTLYEHSRASMNGFSRGLWVLTDIPFGAGVAVTPLAVEAIRRQEALGPYKIQGISTGCASPNGPIRGPSQASLTTLDYPQVACPRDIYVQDRVINTTTFNFSTAWSVKNIFGYVHDVGLRGPADFDGSPLTLLNTYGPRNTHPSEPTSAGGVDPSNGWSDEFQVHGKAGIFDLTAGVFIFRHHYDTGILFADFNNVSDTASRETGFKNSEGYYAQTDVHLDKLLSGLTATGGIRYTNDRIGLSLTPYNVTTLQPGPATVTYSSPAGHAKNSSISYTGGLHYQVSTGTLLYVTTARGYGSGGLQNVAGNEHYDPSVLTNYEAGFKSTFNLVGMPVRINASYFYGTFDKVQVSVFVPITRQDGTSTYTSVISNAAKAIVEGFEAEASIRPLRGLEIGGNVGHTADRYTQFRSIDPTTGLPVDLSNTRFINTPAWKFSLNARYTLPVPASIGDLSVYGSLTHRSQIVTRLTPGMPTNPASPFTGLVCNRARTVANGYPAAIADGAIIDYDCSRGYTSVDAGITWGNVLGHDNLSLDLTVTNLTKNIVSDSRANVVGSFVAIQPALPRMWTIRGRVTF